MRLDELVATPAGDTIPVADMLDTSSLSRLATTPSAAADTAEAPPNVCHQWTFRRFTALVFDCVIALYAIGLVAILATGGVDLEILSLHQAAKPLLTLMIIVPVRLAFDERSMLLSMMARWATRHLRFNPAAAVGPIRAAVPAHIADVLFAVVATRAATFSIGFIANLTFPPSRVRPFPMPFETERFAEIFAAWDSGWYFDIARRGYYFAADGQSSVAFFPLYPLAMRGVAALVGGSEKAIWAAGIAISCAAFALSLLALHRLTEKVFGDRDIARRTVLYLAVFPFSVFLTSVYAESLFLLMSVLAIGRAYDGRWWQAGVWGALTTLTRPNGILIGLPLVLLAMRGQPAARELTTRFTGLLLVPAALAGYCAYVYSLSGDPLGWLSAQTHWGYSLGHPPWQQLLDVMARLEKHGFYDYFFTSTMAPFRLLHGVAAVVFLAITPSIFKRLGAPLGAYVLVSLLVPLSGNALEGVGRYAAVLFPAFMVLASVQSQRLHEAILIVATLFLALFVCLFVTLHPIY